MERFGVPRGKRPRVQVSLDEKERAIARIRGGETKAGISRELGVPESTVRGWVKRAEQRMAREATQQPAPAGNGYSSAAANGYPSSAANGYSSAANNNYSSILAIALAKPQLTITQASATVTSSSTEPLKLPQKRTFNGHSVGSNHLEHQAAAAAPPDVVLVPLASPPLPIPVPLFDSTDAELQVRGWLEIFNAGIMNFTLIATAALLQARTRGVADSQPLWQIIRDYADEAARNVAANRGQYVMSAAPPAIRSVPQVTRLMSSTSPRHRSMRSHSSNNNKAPLRLHITAEDDEDGYTETDV
ncbi:uncharacterized protein LOC110177758 isoform X2 [Drosophila serrata]|uniref:uncharacterized protein LOC110177758 isoform X2 n=1 Tax=Drosophila serrata TaxID=7274 RepID=UPI000A1D1CCA|nr:uncharacterized protein LOC110177758 isoform X2 [Drosophila serrata]